MAGSEKHRKRICSALCLLFATNCAARDVPNANTRQAVPPPTIRWLSSDSALAQAAGAEPATVIIAEAGAVGDRFTRVIAADEKSCVLIMGRAAEKVADLDLYAYSEDGTALAVDDRADPKPTLLLCPPHARHIYVTARIAAGQGMIAVGVHSVPPGRSRRIQATLRAVEQRHANTEVPKASITDVERRLSQHLKDLGARWTPVAQSTLAVDSRIPSVTGLVVEAGSCVDALVLAPLTVSGLDVEVLSADGRTLGRAASTEQDKSIVACAQEQRAFSLQLRPQEGSGSVLVLVSRGSLHAGRATECPIDLSESKAIEPLVEDVHRVLRARQLRIGRRIAEATLVRGEQYRLEDSVEANCTRYDIFAGAPSLDVQARVYSGDGELISNSSGGQYLPLLVCAQGKVSLVFDARTSGGPLWVEKSSFTPTAIVRGSPRAAARLLQRASQLGAVLELTGSDRVRKLVFGLKQRLEEVVTVQAGQCTDVFASLEGQPTGIRLHRVDPDTGELSEGEQHPESAHLQLCCGAGSTECKHKVHVIADVRASGLFATAGARQ